MFCKKPESNERYILLDFDIGRQPGGVSFWAVHVFYPKKLVTVEVATVSGMQSRRPKGEEWQMVFNILKSKVICISGENSLKHKFTLDSIELTATDSKNIS